ncbi:hypothetical protein IAT40_005805 [Kwoniella sp. CBS 6097]
MTTAEQQKIASRKLTHWIENERKIVTFRDISREVGCHVNLAKNLLLEYHNSHPSSSATYLLTGPLLSTSTLNQTQLLSLQPKHGDQSLTQKVRIVDMDEMSEGDRNSEDEREEDEIGFEEVGNDKGAEDGLAGNLGIIGGKSGEEGEGLRGEDVIRWGVVLVGQDDLEEKKKLFETDTLNIHIHSLAPAPISDPAQYLIPNLILRENFNYHNPALYGTISGDAFKPSISAQGQEKKAMKDGGMDWSGAKKVVGGKKPEEKKIEEKKTEEKKPEAKKSFFGASTTSKATTSAAETPSEPAKATSSTAGKPAKSTQAPSGSISSKKKRVIHSDTEEDEPPAAAAAAPASSAPSLSKKGMKAEPTSSMVRADDQKAMEAMMSMDMDMDVDMDMSDPADEPSPKNKKKGSHKAETAVDEVTVKKQAGTPGSSGGVRKKRKVKKTVVETNKKGYTVSRDVWTEESCSESEPEDKKPDISKSKPPMKARDSTSSIGSNNAKTPASSGAASGAGAAAGAGGAKKVGGANLKGQSTLKGFFTKK